jgi:CRISPR-associated protein Csd1
MIFSALVNYAQRNELSIKPGFGSKRVRWIVDLDQTGEARRIRAASDDRQGVKFARCPDLQHPELMVLPRYLQSRGVAVHLAAHFLVDTCGVVTNWPSSLKGMSMTTDRHQAFKALLGLAADTVDSIKPVLTHCEDLQQLDFVQKALQKLGARPNERLTFTVGDILVLEDDSWHSWWRNFRLDLNVLESSGQGLSLVSGVPVATARTHPKIKARSLGGSGFGSNLVSVNEQAFESFGFQQGDNAPFDTYEATAYQTALNALLENAATLGPLKIVHWYESVIPEKCNPFWSLFQAHQHEEGTNFHERIRTLVLELERPNSQMQRLADTRFFAIVATAADGRVRVKNWHASDLKTLTRAVFTWFEDTQLTGVSGEPSFKGFEQLLPCLRPRVRSKKESLKLFLSPLQALALPFWQAVINPGFTIPVTAVTQVILALKAGALTGEIGQAWGGQGEQSNLFLDRLHTQMAVLKAYLRRHGDTGFYSDLNLHHQNHAYHIGRLLAQLILVHQWSDRSRHYRVDWHRYFGLALTAPQGTLEPLIWEALRDLEKLSVVRSNLNPQKLRQFLSTWESLGGKLPAEFLLDDQARFALGYYQQLVFDHQDLKGGKNDKTTR